MKTTKLIGISMFSFVLVMTLAYKTLAQEAATENANPPKASEAGQPAATATETVPAASSDEGVNYSYGKILRISANEMELTEYDYNYETDQETEIKVAYSIEPSTTFENVKAWDELKENDDVEVYYNEKDGKKMAVTIVKELPYEEEDYSSDEGDTIDSGMKMENAVDNNMGIQNAVK